MPEISKITLPSGNTYDIKDATAREAIAALEGGSFFLGVTTTALHDGDPTNPVVIDGQNVVATNGNMVVNGHAEYVWSGANKYKPNRIRTITNDETEKVYATREATGGALTIYVKFEEESSYYRTLTFASGSLTSNQADYQSHDQVVMVYFDSAHTQVYLNSEADQCSYAWYGEGESTDDTPWKWVEFGDLSALGNLAYDDGVSIIKGSGDIVLGESTTFTNAASSVSFAAHTTKNALGANASFTTSVTPTTTNLKATASGTAVNTTASDAFVKSYSPSSGTITLTVGGTGNETLQIGGTGFSSNTYTGLTSLGTPTTGTAVGSITSVTQPTITLATGAAAGAGVVNVATGITSSSTTVSSADTVGAITALGAGTAAAQAITVGTNDKVKVAKYDDLDVDTY